MLTLEAPVPSEVFIYRQARGVPATILTEQLRNGSPWPEGVEIRSLDGAGRFFAGKSPRGLVNAAVSLASEGVVSAIPPQQEASYVENFASGGFGVALAHYGVAGIRFLPASKRAGIRLAAHFHGFDLSSMYRSSAYRRSVARLVDYAGALIVVNDNQYRRLRELGCSASKIHRIPYGVPIPELPIVREESSPVRFVAVGRFVPKKAPDLTLRAFAATHRTCPDATLDFIGDGPMRERCSKMVHDLNIADAVTFHGIQPNDVVMDFYAKSSVFVQHSLTARNGDEEGWPVAVAEAMSRSLPVVSTRHAGIADQVRHGTDGYLVAEGDVQSMQEHMISLARDASLRTSMGEHARQRMCDVGDLKKTVATLRDVLFAVAT